MTTSELVETRGFQSADKFLSALSPYSGDWESGNRYRNWVFRGHRNASWDLTPSGFRQGRTPTPFEMPADTADGQIEREIVALRVFHQKCDRVGVQIPGDMPFLRSSEKFKRIHKSTKQRLIEDPWPFEDWKELAGLAQHCGVATRLLDWTWSSEIAAFFAVYGAVERLENTLRQKGINPRDWDFEETEIDLNCDKICVWAFHLKSIARNAESPGFRYFSGARALNSNLHAQEGLFIVWHNMKQQRAAFSDRHSYDRQWKADDMIGAYERMERSNTSRNIGRIAQPFRRYTLPISEAGVALNKLHGADIDHATVFPDANGAARAASIDGMRNPLVQKLKKFRR